MSRVDDFECREYRPSRIRPQNPDPERAFPNRLHAITGAPGAADGNSQASDFLGKKTYVLADGSEVPSQAFRIRSLKVGNKVLENVNGSIESWLGKSGQRDKWSFCLIAELARQIWTAG
jgi:hypothetical protein